MRRGGRSVRRLAWLMPALAAAATGCSGQEPVDRITPEARDAVVWQGAPRSASGPRPPTDLERADQLQYEHRYAEAAAAADRWLADHPGDAGALLRRSQIRIALGDPRAALADCARAAPRLDALAASACQAQAMAALGAAPAARGLLEAALARSASTPEIASWAQGIAAELAMDAGDVVPAERLYREALENAGTAHYPRIAYAEFLLAHGRAREVLPLLAGAPDDASAIRLRRRALESLP